MTTYILYNRVSRKIVRIDSSGSGTAEGPERDASSYSTDPQFAEQHRVWMVPLAFFTKMRLDVLHGLGNQARVILQDSKPVGVKVNDRSELETHAKLVGRQTAAHAMLSRFTKKKQVQDFLDANPVSDDTELQRIIEIEGAEADNAKAEFERILAGGSVPLSPVLDSKAGQEIKIG